MSLAEPSRAGGAIFKPLASGQGWSVGDFICDAGPGDAPFEERHDAVSIAAVLAGVFSYHSDGGRALLHPGTILLGNAGACYCCRHDHGAGDRCLSARIAPELFAEMAATYAGSSRFRFPAVMLPARRALLPRSVSLARAVLQRDPCGAEEDVLRWVASMISDLAGEPFSAAGVSAQDERRIGRVLRYMERRSDQRLDLDGLAGVAAMSKFHFLRVFHRVTGMTPHQYLIGTRLRQAAGRLGSGGDSISSIAFATGFGDLSTFNAAFRSLFGMSPGAFRRLRRSP